MDIDELRRYCLALPHATENVQWGSDLVFKVDGKMFAVAPLEVAPVRLSFKCTPENFAELCEQPDIVPAPYMARAQWVALKSLNAITADELRELLAESYRLVWERLPKRRREELVTASGAKSKPKPGTTSGKKSASGEKKTAKPRKKSKSSTARRGK
jgi:predicted DNA-binding protein (MmcQ/YjbR family)